MVEVDFGPNTREFKRYDLLQLVRHEQEPFDILRAGQFGTPSDLRRVLIFEKIKGDLTNIFYSMEASNTAFFAHQFKPVMRFIESPAGRLLIADEVGLGKTIEATYIWKELQARQGARRLLVVCPAMLRDKWRGDLRNRFNILAEITSARGLLTKLEELILRRSPDPFVYITSLEGIRTPVNFEDEELTSTRAKLARLLDQNTATDEFAVFDQVIIDEAHYLRNPATGNNRIGRLLRESAHHMVLLTATPFQIGNENLYQLLRLVDPDEFYSPFVFEEMLHANAHVIRAQRALWQQPPNLDHAESAITAAEDSDYFRNDQILNRIKEQLPECAHNVEKRIEVLRSLESRSLFFPYMTRSRKREVLEKRVERAPQVLNVTFSPAEKAIYDHVTQRIRLQSVGRSGVSLFSLIARQRQMASSIVGTLEHWTDRGFIDELLWDDFGLPEASFSNESNESPKAHAEDDERIAFGFKFDITSLEQQDGKFNALFKFLSNELAKNPEEKFVVFAFYRGTLRYLSRRLTESGIRSTIMLGGMTEKDDIIRDFAAAAGPSVLLSSEVGSEGIDLQFCRFLVNYDLPWNPMKVEQRIGRIDRLGQKADRISIINLAVSNTIEDRILMRLYNRIDLFRESIGDLEEILGEITETLMVDLLDPKLNDEERDQRAADTELAIQNKRKQQEALEENAVNLFGFSNYLIDHIQDSLAKGRWLSSSELISLVDDFFAHQYPGTRIEASEKLENSKRITLSDDGKRDLGFFISDTEPAAWTRLHRSNRPILCNFDPRHTGATGSEIEIIEPTHPLIQWIRSVYEKSPSQIHRVSALKLSGSFAQPGDYVFSVHRWSFAGLRSDHLLAYSVLRIGASEPLDSDAAEQLITLAARAGNHFPNANNMIDDMNAVYDAASRCEEYLSNEFGRRLKDFEAQNAVRCAQQETSAKKFAERRLEELRGRLSRFEAIGNHKAIPMTKGLIRKEQDQLKIKLDRVARQRDVDPTMVPLATGLIRIE